MTLYVFPDPRADVQARLAANASRWPAATWSHKHPVALAAGTQHIQYAWDGTPTEEQVRERCTMRITVWTPKGRTSEAIDLASLVRAVLLDSGSDRVWRYTRGAGRLPGHADDSDLEFCTFTLTAETRPSPVA